MWPNDKHLDQVRQHRTDTGLRYGADDDAGGRGRDTDTDHVACAVDKTLSQVNQPRHELAAQITLLAAPMP